MVSNGRSAHCPVNRVTGRAMVTACPPLRQNYGLVWLPAGRGLFAGAAVVEAFCAVDGLASAALSAGFAVAGAASATTVGPPSCLPSAASWKLLRAFHNRNS